MNPSRPPESRFFKRILFCTDFSESAVPRLIFALDMAIRRPDSTLTCCHVIMSRTRSTGEPTSPEVGKLNAEAKKAIDAKVPPPISRADEIRAIMPEDWHS